MIRYLGQDLRHERQEFVEGVETADLTRHRMLHPTRQEPLPNICIRLEVDDKSPLDRKRGRMSWRVWHNVTSSYLAYPFALRSFTSNTRSRPGDG